jgi:hypothetical protein
LTDHFTLANGGSELSGREEVEVFVWDLLFIAGRHGEVARAKLLVAGSE